MRSRPSSFHRVSSPSSRRTLRLGVISPILVLASSCSLVYDLSPDQCGKNDDCAHFGTGYTCDEGICVDHSPPPTGGTSGDAGTGGSGATSGDAGASKGGSSSGGKGGTSGGKGG